MNRDESLSVSDMAPLVSWLAVLVEAGAKDQEKEEQEV